MKRFALFFAFLVFVGLPMLQAQTVQITGRITSSEDGNPLPGVSIIVKGSTVGTTTDFEGKYSLNVPTSASSLVFSFVGLKSQEVAIAGKSSIDVVMEADVVGLEEVVVTALGLKRSEKSLGYSASVVKSDEITSGKSSSLITGLQGKVAGLTVSSAGGTGSSQKVFIRGVSSFTGSNQPLYVINGVPMMNNFSGVNATGNSVDFGNQANDVNPEDVESVTVLKGASATALYGSRAANGVIMINTKRGQNDSKLSVVLNSSVTASEILRTPQTQKNFGQGWPYWDPAENGSWGPKLDGRTNVWGAYSTEDYGIGEVPDLYAGYEVMKKPFSYVENNMRDFYETGMEYINTVSVTGGNEKNSFAMSFGNTFSDGVIPTDADVYKRNIFSFRGDHKAGKFGANFDISYVRKDITATSAGQGNDGATLFQELIQMPVDIPLTQLKDYNSMYNNVDNFFTLYAQNPYWVIDHNGNSYQDDRIYGKVELTYDLFKNTKVLGRLGGDFTNARQKSWNAVTRINPDTWNYGVKSDEAGTYDEYNTYNGQIDGSALIQGDYKLSSDFRLNVMAGFNYNTRTSYSSDSYLYGLAVPEWYSLNNGYDKPTPLSRITQRKLYGALGQFDLAFREFAYLTLSLRNDWSSTLPKGKNSYFYPGINGAVVLTDAIPSLKQNNILSFAKLRAAWGQTGNDAGVYRTEGTYRATDVILGFGNLKLPIAGVAGITQDNLQGNSGLRPEITTDIEFGADMRFLNNRVGIDFAYYIKNTKDQIISSSVAPETRFTTYTRNVGEVENKGIELTLTLVPIRTNSFNWEFTTTFYKNKSEVLKLWDDVKEYNLFSAYGVDFVAEIGQPLGVFKVPQALTTEDGKIVVGASGRPLIDPVNKKVVGSREPDFILGFNNKFSFKGLSLSAVIDYRKGGKFWSNTAELAAFDGNSPITVYNERQPFLVPNSVRQLADGSYVENDIPILGTAMYSYYNHSTNTLMYENMVLDKTFVKLRELTLSYSLPKKLIEKTPFKGLEIGVVGRNLLMWTPKENNFVDPEATNYGNDLQSEFGEFSAAPTSRNYGANIRITF